MNKAKYYIKILIFSISILGFLDLLINPKPIGFLNTNLNLLTSLSTIFGLTILTAKEILKTRFKIPEKVLNGIKIVLLILFLIYLNVFLKQFNFEQNVEYIIVFYHTLPIIYILNDSITEKIRPKYFAILGIIFLIPTLIYFGFIYEAYEAYSEDGTPMIFVHQRIRNWICYVGITLILTSIIRKKTE